MAKEGTLKAHRVSHHQYWGFLASQLLASACVGGDPAFDLVCPLKATDTRARKTVDQGYFLVAPTTANTHFSQHY